MRRLWSAGMIVSALLAGPALADTTFQVTIDSATAANPWGGQAFPFVYFMDGVECPALTLVRGETYHFQMNDTSPVHPLIITSTPEGGGAAVLWNDGVTGQGASGDSVLTFVVPAIAPDTLYYACHNHQRMGWQLLIEDPPCFGDLNGDAQVNLDDLSVLLVNFGTTSGALPEDGDLNDDGAVDLEDLSAMLAVFGTSC